MDRLPKLQGQNIVEATVRIFHLKKSWKLWIDWLKCTAKKLLKQRIEFPFQKEIETMDSLPKIQGQKIVETTARCSI